MAYAVPLKQLPRLPSPQGKIADANGNPTKEFYSWLAALQAWAETIHAAALENEP